MIQMYIYTYIYGEFSIAMRKKKKRKNIATQSLRELLSPTTRFRQPPGLWRTFLEGLQKNILSFVTHVNFRIQVPKKSQKTYGFTLHQTRKSYFFLQTRQKL